jgi:hypothetical protein
VSALEFVTYWPAFSLRPSRVKPQRQAKRLAPDEFVVRPIRQDEVRAAAALHFEFFGGRHVRRWTFLKLGSRFLETVFYRLNLDNPYFFALGAFWGERLVGLQVFTTDRYKMFDHLLKKHAVRLLWHVLKAFGCRPLALCRFLFAKIRSFKKDDVPPHVRRIPASLLLMLVRPEVRTKSFIASTRVWVGGELLEAMEEALRANGCSEYWAETTEDNSFVYNLARRVGARCVGEAMRQEVLLRFIVAPVRQPRPSRLKPTHRVQAGGYRPPLQLLTPN